MSAKAAAGISVCGMGFGKLGFVVSFLALCEHAGSSTMLPDVRHKRFTVRKPAFRQTVPVVKISFFCYRCISAVSYIVRIRPFGLPDARKGPEKCRLRILSATGNAAAFPAFRLSGRKSVPLCKKNEYIAYEPEAFLSDFSDRSASANGEASAAAVRTKPELSGLREAETAACVHTA